MISKPYLNQFERRLILGWRVDSRHTEFHQYVLSTLNVDLPRTCENVSPSEASRRAEVR